MKTKSIETDEEYSNLLMIILRLSVYRLLKETRVDISVISHYIKRVAGIVMIGKKSNEDEAILYIENILTSILDSCEEYEEKRDNLGDVAK